jgi:hypothetical protein
MNTVIGLIILAAIGYGIYKAIGTTLAYVQHRGLSPEEKKQRMLVKADEKQHRALVKTADKGVRVAESDYAKRVKQARKELDKAAAPVKIQKLDGILLTDDRLQTPNGQHPLTPDVQARVDTAGNLAAYAKSRSTLTRMGAGGLMLGPVGMLIGATAKKSKNMKVDTRELYLLIEAETWAETIKMNPDKGQQARALAQAINVAARDVEQAKRKRGEAIRVANARLAEVEQDRTAITEAQTQRVAIEPPASQPVLTA